VARILIRTIVLVVALWLPQTGVVTVQILAINDFHGNLEPPSGSNGQINRTPAGGAEYLATHLTRAIAENPNSIIVGAGDIIGASPLASSLFRDEPTLQAMTALHLSVSSVGNHEFDEGFRDLLRLKRNFQYLSANVVRTATGATLFPPTVVRRVGGVNVGFIGETLKGTPDIVRASSTRGLRFLDEVATANAYAARLKRQGVHAIVLLIHEGGRQHPSGGPADPNGCADFTGAIVPIVEKLSVDIPVVVSGHTHDFYNCRIGGHLVTSASSYGRMITRIALTIDRATDRITNAAAVNEIVTRDVAKDPAQTRIVEKYAALSATRANAHVGVAAADLVDEQNAAGESSLGDIIADAQLAATSAASGGGAEVAFMNSGGIRADVPAGDVTYRQLYEVQPFGNVLNVVTLTGDMLKRLLEQQFDNPSAGEMNVLQVSNGFSYRYRSSAPPGQHVDPDSIAVNGRRIGPTDRVRVEASNFLVDGGAYAALREGTGKVIGTPDLEALVGYFKTHSPVAAGPQNRIIRID